MDALSDLLAEVRLRGTLYFRAELGPDWGIRFKRRGRAPFYIVTRGSCVLEIEGRTSRIALGTGDLIILPRGPAHVLKAHADAPVTDREVFIARHPVDTRGRLSVGVKGDPVTILDGGFFQSEEAPGNPLVESLPPVLLLRGNDARVAAWLEPTLRFIEIERGLSLQGSHAVLTRLAEILLVQAVRAHMSEAPSHRTGWLRGLSDPRIAAALEIMHRRPEQTWTIQSLARHAGMSRTAFASRFTGLVGEPPLSYLTQWRVHRAAHILRTENVGLAAVAERVGYGSEPALNRAFKRIMKLAPGRYRRRARELPVPDTEQD